MGVNKFRRCHYCRYPEKEGLSFERHHIFGRHNSDLTVLACHNCHRILTYLQQKNLPLKVRIRTATTPQKTLHAIHSLLIHLTLLCTETDEIIKSTLKKM